MPARTRAGAIEAFHRPLQQAASCVTAAVLVRQGDPSDAASQSITFGSGVPAALGRDRRLFLAVRHRFAVLAAEGARRGWSVQTLGYLYDVVDPAGRDVLAYHWHPVGRSQVTYPHLHVGCRIGSIDLGKAHLLTAGVSLVGLMRMAITELGVEPLRLDWHEVLDRAERDLSGA